MANWADRTRYLESGKIVVGDLAGKIYNEYQHVNGRTHPLQKRRPLCPVSAGLEGGAGIPADGRPPVFGTTPA